MLDAHVSALSVVVDVKASCRLFIYCWAQNPDQFESCMHFCLLLMEFLVHCSIQIRIAPASPLPESTTSPFFSEFSIHVQQNSLSGFSIDGIVN
jgi:hypothetical protein